MNLNTKSDRKWIFVSGGVLSGLGKGVVSASIGRILKDKNKKIVQIKCDGYLNIDPGTMNPVEHGEVFVLDDGGEVDLDFGHYERFNDITCKFDWNLTSGKIFKSVIDKERRGDYLGKTVQMIPHVTNEIKDKWIKIGNDENADIVIVELGGTAGDIEMSLFFEAARQMALDFDEKDTCFCHLTYVPVLSSVGEQKSKPTQQSTRILQEIGISPDFIIGRSDFILDEKIKEKIALFSNLKKENILSNPNLETVYELPLIFEKENFSKLLSKSLDLKINPDLNKWNELVNSIKSPINTVNIAICGKYTELQDSYISIKEALVHAGAHNNTKINIEWIETTDINRKSDLKRVLQNINAVIIPGGFGNRGTEGKIEVIRYIRENNIPFLGICLGLQLAVVEFARNVCSIENATSTEFDSDSKNKVIDIMDEQKDVKDLGGTMRLGSYTANISKDTIAHSLYDQVKVHERHRHRYEVNPNYHEVLKEEGLILSGMSPDKKLVEFIELKNHPYFIATQAHPELKSTLENPAPLFLGLVKAALKKVN
ncbi:CTP synthetase [Candidatus Woesearchaeota archaeon]|nr:MAG: CTP synthetase [Candidatus Woesearchaeota archaeon]